MESHKLSLEVPTVMSTCTMVIMDTSAYSDIVPVTCETLTITAPGFNFSTQIDVDSGFYNIVTACDLQIQTTNCGTVYSDLPDGVYVIKYSVSPNDQVYVEYNHLRITKALNRYYNALCALDMSSCEPSAHIKRKKEQLSEIKDYLEAAKAKVEFCHEYQKGMTLYNYAIKLLNKLDCVNC